MINYVIYMGSSDSRLSIIIPTFNRKDKLERLIDSVIKHLDFEYEIIVVDDHSTDGTDAMMAKKFGGVKYIRHQQVELVGKSRNDGIINASSNLCLFIDDDNVLKDNSIRRVVEFMEGNTDVGVMGPVTCYLSRPDMVMYAGSRFGRLLIKSSFLFSNEKADLLKDKIFEVDKIPNSSVVKREAALSVGLIDYPRYPFFDEDGELIYKIKKLGYRVLINGNAKVYHDYPYNSSPSKEKINSLRAYYIIRAKIFFVRDFVNGPGAYFALLASIILTFPYYVYKYAMPAGNRKAEIFSALLLGLLDSLSDREELRYR